MSDPRAPETWNEIQVPGSNVGAHLLPCPFCGSDNLYTRFRGNSASINCFGCGLDVLPYKDGIDVVAAWNTRPTPSKPKHVEEHR